MTIRKEVDDLGALADQWRRFGEDWDNVVEEALRDAFTVTGFLEDIWNRTPKSLMQRYAANYSGIEILGVTKRGVKMTRGWQDKLTEKQLARVQKYGHDNLANSILPGGPDFKNIRAVKERGEYALHLSSSLAYAKRMHEAKKPAEGHYWSPGEKHGWTAKQSGNKYLEKPFEENNDKIAEELVYQIERQMRNRGLM